MDRLNSQIARLDAKVQNGGGEQATNEKKAVEANLNYLKTDASPTDKEAFCNFMSKIQAGTIMNYNPSIPFDWNSHTAIGIDEGIMMQAPEIDSTVNCLSAASLWTNPKYHKERVSLYEVPGITANQRQKAADFARKQFGKKYNWALAGTDYDTFYCTKLVVASLQEAGVDFYDSRIEAIIGYKANNIHFNPWDIAGAVVDAGEGKNDLQRTWYGGTDYHGDQK